MTKMSVADRLHLAEFKNKLTKKNPCLLVIACIASLALITSSVLAVRFFLGWKEQQELATAQSHQISLMQATMDEQQKSINELKATISDQQTALAAKDNTIKQQQDAIASKDATIKQQQESIRKLQKGGSPAPSYTSPPISYNGTVTFPTIDTSGLAKKKLIALTFDDGPGPYTGRLLNALKARGARATFFVLGSKVNSNAALLRRMENEGHAVGNHSLNHKNLRNLSLAGINSEMGTTAELIKNVIGHYPYVMRCPGGNSNATVANYAKKIGVPIIYWSIDTRDWETRNTAAVLAQAKKGIKDGSIVLMHDIYPTTVDAAIQFVDQMQAQGYTFVTVPELLAARYGTVQPGKTYVSAYK